MIISATPFRVSLFGGGTDYPSWYNKHGGSVISFSINKYCYITIRPLPSFFNYKYRFVYSKEERINLFKDINHPSIKAVLKYLKWNMKDTFELHHDGDLPARSGLGSSSSFTVGLLNALYNYNNNFISKKKLAEQAIFVEQKIIKESVGSQDQIIASYGGFNRIYFKKNNFLVKPLYIPNHNLKKLEESIVLTYTGISRIADKFAKVKISKINSNNKNFYEILNLVDEAHNLLAKKNINIYDLGKLLNETWNFKKNISKKISSDKLDEIYLLGLNNGAIGGKLLGAGGGGFIAFIVDKNKKDNFIKKMKPYGSIPIKVDKIGSRIIYKNL